MNYMENLIKLKSTNGTTVSNFSKEDKNVKLTKNEEFLLLTLKNEMKYMLNQLTKPDTEEDYVNKYVADDDYFKFVSYIFNPRNKNRKKCIYIQNQLKEYTYYLKVELNDNPNLLENYFTKIIRYILN